MQQKPWRTSTLCDEDGRATACGIGGAHQSSIDVEVRRGPHGQVVAISLTVDGQPVRVDLTAPIVAAAGR